MSCNHPFLTQIYYRCSWDMGDKLNISISLIIPRRFLSNSAAEVLTQWSLLLREIRTLIQYIPRNMHTVFALLCFVVVIHWLIFPYPLGLLHWHCGNLTIAPVPAKQPWWIWINTSCEFIMNDCITTTKQSTTKPCAYFLGYTVSNHIQCILWNVITHALTSTKVYSNRRGSQDTDE